MIRDVVKIEAEAREILRAQGESASGVEAGINTLKLAPLQSLLSLPVARLAFLEDVEAFTRELGGQATFSRLATTAAQIATCGLPTALPKPAIGAACLVRRAEPKLWPNEPVTYSNNASPPSCLGRRDNRLKFLFS
jgi:hypothetical protein